MFNVFLAVFSQENCFTLFSPYSMQLFLYVVSSSNSSIFSAISSGLKGLTNIPPSPAISGMADVLDVMTGVPQAIPSNIGIPKLSL